MKSCVLQRMSAALQETSPRDCKISMDHITSVVVHESCTLQDYLGIPTSIGKVLFMLMKHVYEACTRADLQGVQGSRLHFWRQVKPAKLLNQLRLPAAFCRAP